jgi:hypothetical protein
MINQKDLKEKRNKLGNLEAKIKISLKAKAEAAAP